MKQITLTSLLVSGVLFIGSFAGAQVPELFITSDSCMACHNGLVTPSGEDVSIGVGWRGSMMANAARDPYWQAAIRREALVHPMAAAEIQNECGACHMAMDRYQANAEGRHGEVFHRFPLSANTEPRDLLAADGVSCALCHQISDKKLGDPESFTANFDVDTTNPEGERTVFGPFDVDAGRTSLMRSASRFNPGKGKHIQRSELCATCHTVITHTLDDTGKVVGEMPEQVPYLEWKHSSYADSQSCQSCHMPVVESVMPISSVMGVAREALSRHVFRGGNAFMPLVFNAYRQELSVMALPQELQTTAQKTKQNLQTATARLVLKKTEVAEGVLTTSVSIKNLAGHKLPSAYPSRRAWIHFVVRDSQGKVFFESGKFNSDGSIEGNDNDRDADRYEPHYKVITETDQVQIYEPVMADSSGKVTTVLLSAITYAKDNRLLPKGFEKTTAESEVAVRGKALQDEDFVGGEDSITYAVKLGSSGGPFSVEAELWYQPIGYRWAHNLKDQKAIEIERFVGYYQEMASSSGVVVASARVSIE